MFQYSLVSDKIVDELGEKVLDVLSNVGILCQNEEIISSLRQEGAKVSGDRVFFPKEMSKRLLQQVRVESEGSSFGKQERFYEPPLPELGCQVAQFFFDYASEQRRSGNSKDFIELIKLGSVLHPESSMGHSLLLTDVPPIIEPLKASILLAEYAPNPGPVFAWNVAQADYLSEMGEIYGKENWFTWGAICFSHPFRFDKDVADRFVHIVRSGQTAGLTAMPVAGVTTPITASGFIVVASAEIFATWLSARSLNPSVPLGGSIWGGTIDMKTGEISYSSFDALFYSFALSEFMFKWTGKFIPVGGGEYCDAKYPGYYAALEKAYKAMAIAAFTGVHPSIGQGMLENGKTICPEQLLLERELTKGIGIFARQIDITKSPVLLSDIFDVGIGLNKTYLEMEYTFYHFNEHLWCPEIMRRSGWDGPQADKAVLAKMHEKVLDLKRRYRKPEVDPDKLHKMRELVNKAKSRLL